MDGKTLTVFLSVADTLNFSRSSEALHMSLSAVSRTIARLEQELGQSLFERDKRKVRITAAGGEFREYARKALTDWQQLQRKLRNETELAGEVSLFCSVTASYSVLAPVLAAFRTSHPAVDIMIHTGDQADGISRVLKGLDDVAVSVRPAQLPRQARFLALRQSPLLFCAPAADCAVREMIVGGATKAADFDWTTIPFIVPERGATKEMLDDWFIEQGIRPRIYAQVAGHEAIVAMVGLGLGVGIAPQLVIEASGMAAKIDYIPVHQALPSVTIGLCALQSRLASPLVKSLWDVAEATYSDSI